MSSINVGAYVDGDRCKTKTALKRALKEAPETVRFDVTAAVGEHAGKPDIVGNEIPADAKLSVCGPDPYTARNWWASVSIGQKGNIRVE